MPLTSGAAEPVPLPPAPAGQTWKLVWQDEFDGNKLDTTKWTPRPDGKRKGGWWSEKAIRLDGQGNLVITTFMDGDKPTDGCITTQGKCEHAFGYYVARAKFQKEPGHWSAFWITGPGVGTLSKMPKIKSWSICSKSASDNPAILNSIVGRRSPARHKSRNSMGTSDGSGDARLSESVMMSNYVRETDEEMRQRSNRTYRRIVASLSPTLRRRYGYVPSPTEELEEQLQAAHAAKDWRLVAELAAKLESHRNGG